LKAFFNGLSFHPNNKNDRKNDSNWLYNPKRAITITETKKKF
jgi:hypothetical protein